MGWGAPLCRDNLDRHTCLILLSHLFIRSTTISLDAFECLFFATCNTSLCGKCDIFAVSLQGCSPGGGNGAERCTPQIPDTPSLVHHISRLGLCHCQSDRPKHIRLSIYRPCGHSQRQDGYSRQEALQGYKKWTIQKAHYLDRGYKVEGLTNRSCKLYFNREDARGTQGAMILRPQLLGAC